MPEKEPIEPSAPVDPSPPTINETPPEPAPVDPPASETPPAEPPAEPAAKPAEAAAPAEGDPPPAEPVEYKPNYAYKAYGEEKEMDEFIRPFLTNKDVEDKVRELYSKAGGLDTIKTKHEKLTAEHDTLKGNWEAEHIPLQKTIAELRGALQDKDLGAFFDKLGVKKETVFNWALDEAKREEMSPEQQRDYDGRIELSRQNRDLRTKNEVLVNEGQQAGIDTLTRDLDLALSNPEVNQVMQAFDQSKGRVGAFRDEVILRGQATANQTGKDVPAQEALAGVMGLLSVNYGAPVTPTVAPANGGAPPVLQVPGNKPVIPNFGGAGTAPIRRHPTSIDELKEMRKQKYGD